MRSWTELAQEIPLTDRSTAGEQGKLVFVVSSRPSLAQFISLFTTGKDRLSIVQLTDQFKFFTLRFLSRKKRRKEIGFGKQIFFRIFNPIRRFRVVSNPSSGVQILRNICTRFGRYLYSTKCSWIISRSHGWLKKGYWYSKVLKIVYNRHQ